MIKLNLGASIHGYIRATQSNIKHGLETTNVVDLEYVVSNFCNNIEKNISSAQMVLDGLCDMFDNSVVDESGEYTDQISGLENQLSDLIVEAAHALADYLLCYGDDRKVRALRHKLDNSALFREAFREFKNERKEQGDVKSGRKCDRY